jgi:hypothetical protein
MWMALITVVSLIASITLVVVALSSDTWFRYDAEFSDDIDVPLLEAEGEGFQITPVASAFRYLLYSALVGYFVFAVVLLFLMKLATWDNRPKMTLLVIFIAMMLITAFACVFVVKGGLSRRESYDVTTTPHSTTSAPTTVTVLGASTTTTHKPVVVTYFGDASRFTLEMPFYCILIAMLLMLLVVYLFDGLIAYCAQCGPTPWILTTCGIPLVNVVDPSGRSGSK